MHIRAIALVVALVACRDDTTSPPATLAATYTLQTIDGRALPHRFLVRTGMEAYVVGGSMTFSGNTATFTQLRRERDVAPNPEQWRDTPPQVFTLTFTRRGNDLTIITSSAVVPTEGLALSVSGDGATVTLTYPIEPDQYDGMHRFVFRRD